MKRSLPMTVCFWMTTRVVATPPGGGSVGPPVGPPVGLVGPTDDRKKTFCIAYRSGNRKYQSEKLEN